MTVPSAAAIRDWLVSHVATKFSVDSRSINVREQFSRYGLDSMAAVRLLAELSEHLGRPLAATLVWEHPTIEALASYLAGERAASSSSDEPAQGYDAQEPIAIVGMACRFPGSVDVGSFWRLLHGAVDAVAEVPADRRWDEALLADGVGPEERARVRRGAFLERIDGFDPLFFGISPREAMQMDPQQRLMLELCWEALEDAAIRPSSLKGSRTGVFAAAMWSDYLALSYRAGSGAIGQYAATGLYHSIIANRISYVLGLQGPSLAVDSACSSGLVVVHLACSSLRRGESRVALAGGVNLNVLPESALAMARVGALSPTGRCHTFDARADGYVRGEGGGVVVLKTLSRAIADGDPIRAVISGSVVNNDGASNGLTAPNPGAQEAMLRAAYGRADARAEVQYIEAHGTGTPLGDPIEARALGAVLGAGRPPEAPLLIGSVKTNFGHLEAAAGIAGLAKVALAIEHRVVPPSLHFASPNPHIPMAELGLAVPVSAQPWPAPERRLVAGVSAFGIGGTNSHAVVEEWPAPAAELLLLAAERPEALREEAESLRAQLSADAGRTPLRDVCAEAAARLGPGASRLAVVPRSHRELDSALARFLERPSLEGPSAGRGSELGPQGERSWPTGAAIQASAGGIAASRGVVFVFPGHGAQWPGMARTLLQSEPVLRAALEACDKHIHRYLGWSLLDALAEPPGAGRFDSVLVSYPAVVAVDIALAAWWRSLGIQPAAVVGHSIGEIAAAHAAGVLDLDDAMRIICAEGRLLERLSGQGAMALVGLSWEQVAEALAGFEGRVFRAIKHSVESTVVAGEPAAVAALASALEARRVLCLPVRTSVAPHSPLVDVLRGELFEELRGIRPRAGSVPLISEVTGAEVDGRTLDASHWVRNLCDPVFFSGAVDELIRRGHRLFLDVGPHPITRRPIEANLRHAAAAAPEGGESPELRAEGVVLSSLRRNEDERGALLDTLAALHTLGARVRWDELYPAGKDGITAGAEAWLLPLSARSPGALAALAGAYAEVVRPGASRTRLRDIAYTAGVRREHHAHRLAVVARTREELSDSLVAFARGDATMVAAHGRVAPSGPPKVAFIFPGQGSQWVGMGQRLLAEEPAFRAALEACDRAIAAEAGFSVLEELAAPEERSRLAEIDVVQPVLFAIEVALAALWRAWGVVPDAVVGHSMGEVAAAHVAGILSLADAAQVICRRSRLLRRVSGRGAMGLVELTLSEAEAALAGHEDRLSVAVSNGPRSTVISGDPAALEEVLSALEARGVFCRRVKVDVASHSPQVDPLLDELRSLLRDVRAEAARIPMRSTVSGAMVEGAELDAAYWARNLRTPVLFSGAIQELVAHGHAIFVELSPHPILLPAVEENLRELGREGAAIASVRRGLDERRAMLEALGALWARGIDVGFQAQSPAGGRVVPLPAYPWQRERYWLDAPADGSRSGRGRPHRGSHPLLGEGQTVSILAGLRLWETTLDRERLPWIPDHAVDEAIIWPGAGYIEMALAVGAEVFEGASVAVADVSFVEALFFHEQAAGGGAALVQTSTLEQQPGRLRFQMASKLSGNGPDAWMVHAHGTLRREEHGEPPARLDLEGVRGRLPRAETARVLYPELREMGHGYGPAFQGIVELWQGDGEALMAVRLPEAAGPAEAYRFHPALLDACLQGMIVLLRGGEKKPWVPVELRSLRLFQRPAGDLFCHARLAPKGPETPANRRSTDLLVVDPTGAPVAELTGLVMQRLSSSARRSEEDDRFLEITWEPAAASARRVKTGRFLLLGDGGGLGASLRAALESAGHAVVHAVAGAPHEVPAGYLPVDDTNSAGVRSALADAFRGQAPTAVVHLRSLEGGVAPAALALDEQALEAALSRGTDSVLATVQALVAMGYRDAPRLWLVTRGAQPAGKHAVAVEQSPLVGLARVIAMEHPELRCVRVDLDPARPDGEARALLGELLGNGDEQEVALRGGERLGARLIHRPPVAERVTSVRRDGSYLVTGGLGGLGLRVAGWLAEKGAGHLVLVGRAGAASAEQKAAILALEAKGAAVTVAKADVADRGQLMRVLDGLADSGMPLRGVVHAAGIMASGMLEDLTPGRFREVMRAKARGALHLHELTREAPLDFFVMYASVAGLFGYGGTGNYAAANALLDALAHHRRALGLPALSVDWGMFSEAGMVAGRDSQMTALISRGMRSMTPAEGLSALARLLDSDRAQVCVMSLDVQQLVESYPAAASSSMLSRLLAEQRSAAGRASGEAELLARLARAEPAARASLLEGFVRTEACRVLRIPEGKLDTNAPLTSLGMDSLMGLELRNRVEAGLGIKMPATLLWTYPTVATLSRHLDAVISTPPEASVSVRTEPTPELSAAAVALDALSDDELMHALRAERSSASAGADDELTDDELMHALRAELDPRRAIPSEQDENE